MTPDDDKNLEVLEAVFHDAAMHAVEEGESTPEQKAWAAQLHAKVAAQLDQMEQNLALPAMPRPALPIRPRYLAMVRDELLASVSGLISAGRLQVAYRNLSALSDDDLRRLLQSVDPDPE
jgi:hypothetical protein